MEVLLCLPTDSPLKAEFRGTLKAMQDVVGGYIETIQLKGGGVIVCNEEGKIRNLKKNINKPEIRGVFFICGQKGSKFCSLTEEQFRTYQYQAEEGLL